MGKILKSSFKKLAPGKSVKSKNISKNEIAESMAIIAIFRVCVITDSSNFIKIREAGRLAEEYLIPINKTFMIV